jgi:DNA-binding transcriptional ArsR family regulator
MDKRIILDDKSFKALSAETRIQILKKLLERRMTLSELSKKLSLKNSTIKEHCELLMGAELLKKIDEGRKWKYYELTNKGKNIINPNPFEQAQVLVMLSVGAIIFSGILLLAMQGFIETQEPQLMKSFGEQEMGIMATDSSNEMQTNTEELSLSGINYNLFSISVIFALVIGIFAGWFVGRKT